MTVAVAFKDGDKVWVGADSQVSSWLTKGTLSNRNNCKLIIPPEEKETVIAITGYAKMLNVLNVQDRFIDELTYLKNEFDYRYVVTKIVPRIFNLFDAYGLLNINKDNPNKKSFSGSLIFAHKDKLFKIEGDGFVQEIDDFVSIGSGEFHSHGYLNEGEEVNKKEAVIKSIKSAIKSASGVGYPIVITNTIADDEIEIVE